MSGAMLETMDHDLHKSRRSAVSNFFSKSSVQQLQPLVIENVSRLMARLKQEMEDKTVVNVNYAMAGLTLDVISAYSLGEPMHALDNPEYGKEWMSVLRKGVQMRPVGRQFPWLMNNLMKVSIALTFEYDHPADCPVYVLSYRRTSSKSLIPTWRHLPDTTTSV
jgi:cytochrome P450